MNASPLPPSLTALDFTPVMSCNWQGGCATEATEALVSVHRSDATECTRVSFCTGHASVIQRALAPVAYDLAHNIPATWSWDLIEVDA